MYLQDDPYAQKRKQFITLVMKRVKPGTGSSLEFLNQRTLIYPVTNLKAIILQAPFVIVGGIATRLYMPERNTLDLDILVLAEDAPLIHKDLERAKSKRIGELSIPGSQWQLSDGTSLDVIEATKDWATEAIANPNYAPDGLPIIALPYLVLMKLTASRTQDLADISRMMGGTEDSLLQEVRRIVQIYLPSAAEDLESLIALGKLERET